MWWSDCQWRSREERWNPGAYRTNYIIVEIVENVISYYYANYMESFVRTEHVTYGGDEVKDQLKRREFEGVEEGHRINVKF